jgi:hypothetical protein
MEWPLTILFAVDYVARVAGAPDRVSWIVRHPLELVVPMLRPLRVLRGPRGRARGRFVGVGLMIGGIALLGTVTATFASWLVEAVREESDETEDRLDAVRADLLAIHERLDRVLEER